MSSSYWVKKLGILSLGALVLSTSGCQEILNFISPEQLAELKKKAQPKNACKDEPREPGFLNIARLNRRQLRNTYRDLTGYNDDIPSTYQYPADTMDGGFSNNAAALGFNGLMASAVMNGSDDLAGRLAKTTSSGGIRTCTPSGASQYSSCATTVLQAFMPKAYRRPVTSAEVTSVRNLVLARTNAGDTFEVALKTGLQAVLMHMNFLYRFEFDPDPGVPESRALTNYELASRLSYMLWNSMPDQTLLNVAATGDLQNEVTLLGQVDRMINSDKSSEFAEDFVSHWLEFHHYLDLAQPSPASFPGWNDGYRDLFRTESRLFFTDILKNNLPVRNLLDAPFTYANNTLASHYGIGPVVGSSFVKVSTASTLRRGILGQGAVLMAAAPTRTSPVKRGRLVQVSLLCTTIPDPPPGVEGDTGDPSTGTTLREQLEAHRANPVCASCHDLMDPPGLAFENFDSIGKYRTEDEAGNSVDASGRLISGESFANAAELAPILAQKDEFRKCLVTKLFTYSLAHTLSQSDRCEVSDAVASMTENEQDTIRGALNAIVLSDAFRKRTAEGEL